MKSIIHVGNLIQSVRDKKRITTKELAEMIHRSRQTVHNIYNKESIDTELLFLVSTALKHDFFQDISMALQKSWGYDPPRKLRDIDEQDISIETSSPGQKPFMTIQLNFDPEDEPGKKAKNLEWLNRMAREFMEMEDQEENEEGMK